MLYSHNFNLVLQCTLSPQSSVCHQFMLHTVCNVAYNIERPSAHHNSSKQVIPGGGTNRRKTKHKKRTQRARTAKEPTTQQKCAGMAQMQLINPKDSKPKIPTDPRLRVINRKRQHKTPQHQSAKLLSTKRTTPPLVKPYIRYTKCYM